MRSGMIIHPDELSVAWVDRLADAGVGVLGIHPCGGKEAAASLRGLLDLMQTKEYRRMIDYARERGLEVEYEIHAAGYLMPRELFREHPDYFRMNERGERTADYNFCVSSSDALELYAEWAAALALSLYGSSRNFYFWMDDGHGLHCRCPKCSALSPSDQQLLVLNRVAEKIRGHLPDARVAYLAYMDTVTPPVSVRPAEGIFLEYAPFAKYTEKGEHADALIREEARMIAPLMRCFDREPAKVLEYWYDNSLYSHWQKPPAPFVLDEAAMRRDIDGYLRQGFGAISTFACYLGSDYEALHGGVDVTPFGACIASR